MSNTINKHITKLNKSIDNKLFDLLVDIEDQLSTANYQHWKINHELRKVILRKVMLDKNIKLTPNRLGVYGYVHNEKIQYKEYQLTLGKGGDNMIYPMYAVLSYKDKVNTRKFEYNANDIKKKIQYNLVNVFKTMSKDFESIHNNTIELNHKFYRYNNIKYIYPEKSLDIVNNYDSIRNFSFDVPINKHTNINDFEYDDLQEQIHNNIVIKRLEQERNHYNEHNDNINYNTGNNYNNSGVKYVENHIEDDYIMDDDKEDDIIDNESISKQIKFYEDAIGKVSNTHKNRDRIKYLESLKNKFYHKQKQAENFQKYYKYAKKIDENDI